MKTRANVWWNSLLCLCLCISLLVLFSLPFDIFQSPRHLSASSNTPEVRGVWLTNVASGVFFAPWSINRAITSLSRLNFNTLYPVVWNRGHTFYPSQIALKETGQLEDPLLRTLRAGSDVLAEIIEVAHREGLTVLPWFEYGFIVPADSALAKRHRSWLTQNQQGQYYPKSSKTDEVLQDDVSYQQKNILSKWLFQSYQQRVKNFVWLNPNHPEVQKFIKDLIVEVVTNYDVDGIQLDDHFGLPVELGYDPLTIKLYQKDHQGKKPPRNFRDGEWMRWRAAKLTNFMEDLVKTVRIIRPDVRISLSPNSHYFSYQNYLQDWKTWVKRGLVDELVLQVYRSNLQDFQAQLSQAAVQFSRQRIPVSVGILTGTWRSPVSILKIEQQVKIVRERGFAGVSFFYWETLWGYFTPESPRKRRQVFEKIFAQPALRPEVAALTNY
ncbi:glycoside hydrolase family 10 protein [Gloeothece verrucosa]|uniref:Glycosyl hydrolase-like 10 domain-containing protein n=1 Tax=Gloeothece verrucosa (strain PCC 7822) TaxID=497965 RepID=E0U9U1_GLOV7|nr:family 10 glycosylhydrolase [Gloeothece verrucosa]ADN15011.1 protein of unknown function DUF187 [Gloeothece verrucosa PCC 7822]